MKFSSNVVVATNNLQANSTSNIQGDQLTNLSGDNKYHFNVEMNLTKAQGIFYVVMGHLSSKFLSIVRQPYTFHMPLFYFISGYFYNEKHENEKIKYIWSKFKKNVITFYVYYIGFILIAAIFWWKYKIILGTISLYSFFVSPFTVGVGNPGFFLGPSWFILSLFFVQIFFIFAYPLLRKSLEHEGLVFCFFVSVGAGCIYLSNKGFTDNDYFMLVSKTMIGSMFYYFGYFYKKYIEGNIEIFKGKILILALSAISFIMSIYPDVVVGMGSGTYGNYVLLPIIISCLGIYITLFTSKALSKVISDKSDILHKIGKNSLYIMLFHPFIFFLTSFIYYQLNNTSNHYFSALTVFPYCPGVINLAIYWPLYLTLGLLVPTLFGETLSKLKMMRVSKDVKTWYLNIYNTILFRKGD